MPFGVPHPPEERDKAIGSTLMVIVIVIVLTFITNYQQSEKIKNCHNNNNHTETACVRMEQEYKEQKRQWCIHNQPRWWQKRYGC